MKGQLHFEVTEMESVEGGTELHVVLKKEGGGRITDAERNHAFKQMGQVLSQEHRHGYFNFTDGNGNLIAQTKAGNA